MPNKPRPTRSARPLAAVRRHRKALGVALAAAAAAVLAGAFWLARARHARTHASDPSRLNVLLVTVDSLRADALGAYGHRGAQTPWMDRLAAAGMRFVTARAHSVATLPSHANLLSGRYPLTHGVRDANGPGFPAGLPTLATLLKQHGYRTGAFVSAPALDSRFGLAAGFEVYDDAAGGAATPAGSGAAERAGTETVQAALRWMQAQGDAPFFCFVHLNEPHFPYAPPPPFAERFPQRPYDGEVAAADAALEPLLRPLLDAGGHGRTLVVLTSDHGEALGEHGEPTHGRLAYEPTLRVPLVLFAASVFQPGVAKTPARHVDVLPTVLDFLGLERPPGIAGESLRALLARGPGEAPPAYFEASASPEGGGGAPRRGVVHRGWKYIDQPAPELYDLGRDPGEERNLAAARPEEAERLRRVLADLRAGDRS